VIRYEGPKGGPGMREMLSTTRGTIWPGHGRQGCADHRWPVFRRDPWFPALAMLGPEAAEGGPIGLLNDGDIIEIDAVAGILNVQLSDEELAARREKWIARETDYASGALWKYAQTVGSARHGAVTHPGGAKKSTAMQTSSRTRTSLFVLCLPLP